MRVLSLINCGRRDTGLYLLLRLCLILVIGCWVLSANAGVIAGRIFAGNGGPARNATVSWSRFRSSEEVLRDRALGVEPQVIGAAHCDADGRFKVLLRKSDGTVSVHVTSPGLPSVRINGPFDFMGPDENLEIWLSLSAEVSGRVVDEAEKPIKGARVEVAQAMAAGDGDVLTYAESTSDAQGWYVIPNAPRDRGFLRITHPGFVPIFRPQVATGDQGLVVLRRGGSIRGTIRDSQGNPASKAIVLSSGTATEADSAGHFLLSGIPLGTQTVEAVWGELFVSRKELVSVREAGETSLELTVQPAGLISGTAVEEGSGKPISGAMILASVSGFNWAGRESERRVRTDGAGRFRLTGLIPRRYVLEGSKHGFLMTSIAGIEVGLTSPTAIRIALRRGTVISGRVLDDKGKTVAGASIAILPEREFAKAMRNLSPGYLFAAHTTLSRPDGTFRFDDLPPLRNVSVGVSKARYVPALREDLELGHSHSLQGIRLVLRPGLQIHGRVVDLQGRGIVGTQIWDFKQESGHRRVSAFEHEIPDAITGPDGTFTLRGLEKGGYQLSVVGPGCATKTLLLRVPSGMPSPIVLGPGVIVSGEVRNTTGQPIVEAAIVSVGEGNRPQRAYSDQSGRFLFDGITPNLNLTLDVLADGYVHVQKEVFAPTDTVSIVLQGLAKVRGQVVDSQTLQPISNFNIGRSSSEIDVGQDIPPGGFDQRSFHSVDGSFELEDLQPGTWTLHVSAANHLTKTMLGIELGEHSTREDLLFSLRPGGVLLGRMVDAETGAAIPNVFVSWQPSRPNSARGLAAVGIARLASGTNVNSTDADGRFRFDGLPEGKIILDAYHPDFAELSKEFELTSGEESRGLALERASSVSGVVIATTAGKPVVGTSVYLERDLSGDGVAVKQSTRTNSLGKFAFDNLNTGSYSLRAEGSPDLHHVTIVVGQQLDGVHLQTSSDQVAGKALAREKVVGSPR